jgi:hypothetical protein
MFHSVPRVPRVKMEQVERNQSVKGSNLHRPFLMLPQALIIDIV